MIRAPHRVAIYLRVSTPDQTTANQERELREVASRMGCEVIKRPFGGPTEVLRYLARYTHRWRSPIAA